MRVRGLRPGDLTLLYIDVESRQLPSLALVNVAHDSPHGLPRGIILDTGYPSKALSRAGAVFSVLLAQRVNVTEMSNQRTQGGVDWAAGIFRALKDAGVRQASYLPDVGHSRLIELCQADEGIKAVPLTTEEEGVAQLAGAWLGGERGVLLVQSSGAGNCINMLAMARECRFPILMLVTMRGEWGEFNPWQVPMGQSIARVLEHVGVIVHHVDEAARVAETVDAAAGLAFGTSRIVAVIVSQRVIGFKDWNATQR